MKNLILLSALLAASPALAGTIRVTPGPNAQERLQTALIDAKPGDTVLIAAGRYELTDGLSLDVPRVTVRGAGPARTILSFKGQKGAGQGLLVTSNDVVLRGFAVEDSKGDGIKSKHADNIVYVDLRVEWTGGPKASNGAYGVYPVESTNLLIDRVTVKGASDAGIYVGQSKNIIVRSSTAMFNVAGIEIENSFNADIVGNIATHNTGGILVFDLPNLPQKGGHDIRVFRNQSLDNDTPNFAPKGNIVAAVPMGTGVMVMANRNVHVFANVLAGNATANVFVVAYKNAFTDKGYDPYVKDISVRSNKHGRAGFAPSFPGGKELQAAIGGAAMPIFWDGVGGEAARVHVSDGKVLNLGLAKPDSGLETARPALVDLSKMTTAAEPKAVVLPHAMETAAK